ncbi:hypothetical protein [Hoeflea sp.]|uniref:hypothetical protein n=1 Tax=Hoeflea sp. TaxID=1940281 RepID=UPI003B0262D8
MTIPIFIIASGRSGSTQLGHYFGQVRGSKYLGEIFKRPFRNEVGWQAICELIGNATLAERLHEHDQVEYLNTICEKSTELFLVVKLFYKHRPNSGIWDHVYGGAFPVLHLWREDIFAQFVSLERARATGQWTQWKGKRYAEDNTLIEFRRQDYLDWRSFMASKFLEVQLRLSGRSNVESVEYKQISDHEFIRAAIKRSVGFDIKPREMLVKQATRPALDYVRNRTEAAPFAADRLIDFVPAASG